MTCWQLGGLKLSFSRIVTGFTFWIHSLFESAHLYMLSLDFSLPVGQSINQGERNGRQTVPCKRSLLMFWITLCSDLLTSNDITETAAACVASRRSIIPSNA